MRIPCPLCGERGAEEFAYHGDATLRRPDRAATPEAWADYVYLRDNPPGRHSESAPTASSRPSSPATSR